MQLLNQFILPKFIPRETDTQVKKAEPYIAENYVAEVQELRP